MTNGESTHHHDQVATGPRLAYFMTNNTKPKARKYMAAPF